MIQFTFSIPTLIRFGAGVSMEAGATASSLISATGGEHGVLVVLDPGVEGLPWVTGILDSLESAGLSPMVFHQVQPNPRDVDVYAAAETIRSAKAGAVVGIGGGSTIDTAKGAALIATCGGRIGDYAGWGRLPGSILPVIAVPTTAGSGSVVTSWAVITDTSAGQAAHTKLALGDRNLSPAAALVDPELTLSLPASLTAATGMDALTHAIEAYLCALSSPLNDVIALEAIRLAANYLSRAAENGRDREARQAMLLASLHGGIAINNADVAGVHCLSEGLGSLYDAPHGLLNAILLPYMMDFWLESCSERFIRIAEAFGGSPQPQEAVDQVVRLAQKLALPSLAEIGVKAADLPAVAALAEANVSNSSNPRPMSAADYLSILHQAMQSEQTPR
jgi:alcohol dehydrogenase